MFLMANSLDESHETHFGVMDIDPLPGTEGQGFQQTPKLIFMGGDTFGQRGYDKAHVLCVERCLMASQQMAIARHWQSAHTHFLTRNKGLFRNTRSLSM
jgi:hypothetical protein